MGEQQQAPEGLTPMTFKIYVYILKHNPEYVHLAQISHDFHISPQLAFYYVQKLVKLGYLEHQEQTRDKKWDEVGYKVKKIVPIAPLKNYLFVAQRFLIPRQAIYVVVFFALLCLSWFTPYPQIVQALTVIPLIIALYDLYKQKEKL
jgi:predicted DNA-binding transcriptional regulator